MAPKWLRRPRRACAGRVVPGFLALVLASVVRLAHADANALPIVDTTPPRATVGVVSRSALKATGGTAPYLFALAAGALPPGLALGTDGRITGVAARSGSYAFTVRVSDSAALPASVLQSYVMRVQDRPDPALDPNTIALVTQQASTVRRFAIAQIANLQTRLIALRSESAGWCGPTERRATFGPSPGSADPLAKAGLAVQPPQEAQSFDMPVDNCRTLADRSTTLWTAGALNIGAARTQSGTFQFNSQGVTLGGDTVLRPDLAFGAGVGLARDESLAFPAGSVETGAAGRSVSGYLSYRPIDVLYVEAVVGLGGVAIDGTRVTASGNEAVATRRGEQKFISLAAGSRFASYGWRVSPYTRVDHVRATLRQSTEGGASAEALALADEKIPSLRLVAGATAQTSFATVLGTLAPRTSLEYRRELDRSESGALRYADDPYGATYTIVPGALERDSTSLGLGADLLLPSRWNIGLAGTLNRSAFTNSSRVEARIGRVF